MSDLNSITLSGRLTRDLELRYTPSGTAIAKGGLATHKTFKDKQGKPVKDTTFSNITMFGAGAEQLARLFKSGDPILIQGEMRMNTYQDKMHGIDRQSFEVIIDRWFFHGPVKGQKAAQDVPAAAGSSQGAGESNGPEGDDVPF